MKRQVKSRYIAFVVIAWSTGKQTLIIDKSHPLSGTNSKNRTLTHTFTLQHISLDSPLPGTTQSPECNTWRTPQRAPFSCSLPLITNVLIITPVYSHEVHILFRAHALKLHDLVICGNPLLTRLISAVCCKTSNICTVKHLC